MELFFYFARLLRLNRKTRHSLLRLKSRPESRAANHCKEEFFNLYKILRLRYTPQHRDEDAPGFASIGRQNKRWLRRTGLLRLCEETMKERSAGKMLETWRWMQNRQVCVGIDICYIKQCGTHPTIQDQSQICTPLCVVEIPCRLPYFRGHPTIDVLIRSIGSVAAAVVTMKRGFHGIVTDLGLLADRPPAIPSIRAPLDIVRDPLPNPGWKPLLLSKHQVSSYKIRMRSLAVMEQKTIKWTDPPTTQHVYSLDAVPLHGRPYRSRRHLQFSYCGHRWLHCPRAMVAVLQVGTADVLNNRNVGPADRYQQPKMRTRGGLARKDRYARVACAALRWQEVLLNCSIKGACFSWNCIIKCSFSILCDDCLCHVTLRIQPRGSWNGLSGDCDLSVQRNTGIPLLNQYGLPFKRTRVELFFDFARLLRLNRKTRHSLLRLKSRPESRAANHCKEEFFNLYKILRLRYTPQHQDEDAPGFASIGQQNKRWLRRTGLLRLCEESMKERSAGKMLEKWRWMQNRQVCVGIDICYIKQCGTHPTIQDQSQNCRPLCVVEIPCRLPYFRGHPTIDVLIRSIGSVAAAVVRMKRGFHGIVTDLGLLADRPPAIPSIRAPLDIVRDPLPNPGSKPLLLSTHQVFSYKILVDVLDYIASLSNHTHRTVPILVDENTHTRCLKVLYSDRTQRWNWHEKLKGTPVLYGCWHPYKYLVTNLWCRFHSRFVYFRFGRLGVGKQ